MKNCNSVSKRSKKCNFNKITESSSRSLNLQFERLKYVFQYEKTCCQGGWMVEWVDDDQKWPSIFSQN